MANTNKNLNSFFNVNKFLGSFNSYEDIPYKEIKKECCFVGRSNVGKSSLLNAVTKTKKLAKTSKTPGRTQSINVFAKKIIGGSRIYLVTYAMQPVLQNDFLP